MKQRNILYYIMIAVVLTLSCGGGKTGAVESKIEAEGPKIPDFSAFDSAGKEFTQREISNGPAVACFLVSWCLTCGYELVALQEISDEMANYKIPIVIFSFEDPAEFKPLLDSLSVNLPIVKADSALFAGLRIDAIPTRILFSNGREAMRITGAPSFNDEKFRMMLRKAVGLPPEGLKATSAKTDS